MGARNTTAIETQRPAAPLMNYERGALEGRPVLEQSAVILGWLLLGAIGATIAWIAWPAYNDWTAPRVIWAAFGGGVGVVSIGVVVSAALLMTSGWWGAHNRRLLAFEQDLNARELNGGLEVERAVSQWEFDTDIPLHALVYCISVHRREMERQQRGGGAAPWAYRNAVGPLMIGGRRMLTVDEWEARQAGAMLEQLGMVRGRGDKSAGEWVPESYEELIDLFDRNWRRVGTEA